MLKYVDNFPRVDSSVNFTELTLKFADLPLFKRLSEPFDRAKYGAAPQKLAKFERIIHLGTGGSSLGARALYDYARDFRVTFDFFDNIDPLAFVEKFSDRNLDLARTGVLVVSKSGDTAETLVQLATVSTFFTAKGLDLTDNLAVICQKGDSALREFAETNAVPIIDHDTEIGGRFSIFAETGDFPGLLGGLDMERFRQGAMDLWEAFKLEGKNHPVARAAEYLALSEKHPVNFIYSERLKEYGAWFAQLWAESLGKTGDAGKKTGTIPIRAMGSVDQHSQLQLYLGGTPDKFFTFLGYDEHPDLPVDDLRVKNRAYSALKGKTLKELYAAEFMATYRTIRDAGLPVRRISFEKPDIYAMGQLTMGAALETLIVANIWRVNPFDQPAVESGKKLAIEYLNDHHSRVDSRDSVG